MPLAGKAAMINWSDVAAEDWPAYRDWHDREHMRGAVALPGFQRGRRHIAIDADRTFFVCYEVDDFPALVSPEYKAKVADPSPTTMRVGKLVRNAIRGQTRVRHSVGTGQGGFVLTLRFDAEPERENELSAFLHDALCKTIEMPEILAAHCFVSDIAASSVVSVERRNRPTAVPPWAIMLESTSLDPLHAACDAWLADTAMLGHGAKGPCIRGTYRNEVTVTKLPFWQD